MGIDQSFSLGAFSHLSAHTQTQDKGGIWMSLILFPHSILPESMAKKIIPLFGHVTVCFPWYIEPPPFFQGHIDQGQMTIMYPPDELKPAERIQKILSEYYQWMEQNRDRRYTQILESSGQQDLTESATWEIRQTLKQISDSNPSAVKGNTLQWHIILHLARAIEKQHMEADRVLKKIKHMQPLLEGSVEETKDIHQLVADLSEFDHDPTLSDMHFTRIIEAWLQLFGGNLSENALLMTLSRQVMHYVSEKWDDLCLEGKSLNRPAVHITLPALSHDSQQTRTNIDSPHRANTRLRQLRDSVLAIADDPIQNLAALDALSEEFNGPSPHESSGNGMAIKIKYLCPISGQGLLPGEAILRQLSNKTIMLIEEGSTVSG
jgi:hypothetical protein